MSDAMTCPKCGAMDSKVKDSRASKEHKGMVRRRRVCACGKRFRTLEMMASRLESLLRAERALAELATRAAENINTGAREAMEGRE